MSERTNKRKSTTIEEIRWCPVPKSPRKISEKLTCAVVNKSELRPTKNGTMFSINLCDESSKSTLWAVCFNETIFPKFEATKSCEIRSFKIKKAFAGGESVEMLLDREVSVVPATTDIAIVGRSNVKISEILIPGNMMSRFIHLKAKVMKIQDLYEVGTLPDTKIKHDIVLADETGHINFVLWRQQAENTSSDKKWYTANTSVVLKVFNWSEAKLEPNECDKVVLLTSKYRLRINEKRIIENAIQVDEDEFPKVDLENVGYSEEGMAELPGQKSKRD